MSALTPQEQAVREVQDQLHAAQRAVDNAQHVLNRILNEPVIPEPTSRYISFSKKFSDSTTRYEYVAIRTNGSWYVSGATGPQGVSWKTLAKFIAKDNRLTLDGIVSNLVSNELPF